MSSQNIDECPVPGYEFGGSGVLLMSDTYVHFGERNPDYANNTKREHSIEYPGGKRDPNENILECAKRELLEEFNLLASGLECGTYVYSADDSVRRVNTLFIVNVSDEFSNGVLRECSKIMSVDESNNPGSRELRSILRVTREDLVVALESKDKGCLVPCLAYDGSRQCLPLRTFNRFLLKVALPYLRRD